MSASLLIFIFRTLIGYALLVDYIYFRVSRLYSLPLHLYIKPLLIDWLEWVSLHLAEKHFPENHLPEKHFPELSFSRINICQKSNLPE